MAQKIQPQKNIEWELIKELCVKVGAAVDIADRTMREARRSPAKWTVEADLEAIDEMQTQIIDMLDYLVDILTTN